VRQADLALGRYDGAGLFSPDAKERLWLAVPEGLRPARLTARTIPGEFVGAFSRSDRDDSIAVDFRGLPEPLARELSFALWRIIETGGKVVHEQFRVLANGVRDVLADPRRAGRLSLMDASCATWQRELFAAAAERLGRMPSKYRRQALGHALRRAYRFVWFAYDERPWWRRELWSLDLDPRIPRREREPSGRKCLYFDRYRQGWLRLGLQWFLKCQLEANLITWSTATTYFNGLLRFDEFLAEREVPGPWLADDPLDVRPLMLDYLTALRVRVSDKAERAGRPISTARLARLMTDVEQFYGFMTERRHEASRALHEPGWERLGGAHVRFWHFGEKPRPPARVDEAKIIDDHAMRSIMEQIERLGQPVHEGGLGDEQAMRVLMLVAMTARRINEILLIDFDPILPLTGPAVEDTEGFVAKLRYGQTKIDGAPDTILIDADTVAVIRAQQAWTRTRARELGIVEHPRHLFLATNRNRHLRRPYPSPTLHNRLRAFAALIDVHDSADRKVLVSRTHHFRHTRATSLLNAGVPLHVIQRYLGHLSPTMTMRYAQVTAETMEREFPRFTKIGAQGQPLEIDPRDLYDQLQLDQRADRILPNGWCLLPPRQTCDRGNACLTCTKFATDATHLDEHEHQLDLLADLIAHRQRAFRDRTGREMPEDNIWLAERRKEQRALRAIVDALDDLRLGDGAAVRGAGARACQER
jgi:integrase